MMRGRRRCNIDIKNSNVTKKKSFTCELIQAAARAATMQGHAGLDADKGQKFAKGVNLIQRSNSQVNHLVWDPGDSLDSS